MIQPQIAGLIKWARTSSSVELQQRGLELERAAGNLRFGSDGFYSRAKMHELAEIVADLAHELMEARAAYVLAKHSEEEARLP